jgi:hypothetical protein
MNRLKNDGSLADAPPAAPSAPIPLTDRTTTKCPRCLRGTILGGGQNASCMSCGYEPITPSEYASAEAWLAALPRDRDGEIVTARREPGIPGEQVKRCP